MLSSLKPSTSGSHPWYMVWPLEAHPSPAWVVNICELLRDSCQVAPGKVESIAEHVLQWGLFQEALACMPIGWLWSELEHHLGPHRRIHTKRAKKTGTRLLLKLILLQPLNNSASTAVIGQSSQPISLRVNSSHQCTINNKGFTTGECT